jgi:hypothetical protein
MQEAEQPQKGNNAGRNAANPQNECLTHDPIYSNFVSDFPYTSETGRLWEKFLLKTGNPGKSGWAGDSGISSGVYLIDLANVCDRRFC